MKITTKAEFYRLWNLNALGHKLRTWEDPKDALASGAPIIGLRQIGAAGGGRLDIVPRDQVIGTARVWTNDGLKFMCCEAAPDELGTLQGECCRTFRGWEGTMGLSRGLRMREAAKAGLLVPRSSSVTRFLLRTYLSAPSLDDLDAILDLYPDAVIEFTCYDLDFGRGRNTIFWEVRDY